MDQVIWIAMMSGCAVVTLFAVVTMIIMRRRERTRDTNSEARLAQNAVSVTSALEKIDAAADTALTELHTTVNQALAELDEKYQAMLFLYNLLDEKKKEVAALMERSAVHSTPSAARSTQAERRTVKKAEPRVGNRARLERIKILADEGLSVSEIAKQLNIGQGEVRLTMDLAERQSL